MIWFLLGFLTVLAIVLSFFFVFPWFYGAPFEPTDEKKLRKIMKLAKIKRGEKAVDLGSGDGRIVIALAKAGADAHGYEINPFLVLLSRIKIKKLGLKNAHIHWKSFWGINLRRYDIIIMFQFHTVMNRLKNKLKKEMKNNSRIVSYYWKLPDWKIVKKIENIYLYKKK
ncbi:MAG TPA: methyltransferase domain-containing protein [Candidatus Nanoarchaeia archaeon]|nr:methyltransferase domain-containing protein [Candidatus Nanoarchaeia archaeon]